MSEILLENDVKTSKREASKFIFVTLTRFSGSNDSKKTAAKGDLLIITDPKHVTFGSAEQERLWTARFNFHGYRPIQRTTLHSISLHEQSKNTEDSFYTKLPFSNRKSIWKD
jgi:hypothetical protein